MKTPDQVKTEILQKVFLRIKSKNANYSARAFARDIGVSHSLVSLVMAGKRPVSDSLAQSAIDKLQLEDKEKKLMALGMKAKLQHQKITVDRFALISDWVCYAVLSLLETKNFKWDYPWVANRLNIPEKKAKQIMTHLLAHGFVALDTEAGRYKQTTLPLVVENTHSTEATKQFNRELIEKAKDALDNVPFEKRDLSNIVFAMDPAYISYAIERIRNFRRSLSHELEHLGEQKEAYALTVQIIPLSETKE